MATRAASNSTTAGPRKRKIGRTEIAGLSTDYEDRPAGRGYEVVVNGWNDYVVSLVIRSDNGSIEALIDPNDLAYLARRAVEEAPKW